MTPVSSPMPYVEGASLRRGRWRGYPYKAFVVEFSRPLEVLTTLEGFKKVDTVGNFHLHPRLWGQDWDLESLMTTAAGILEKKGASSTFLFTGVDMDKIAFSTQRFRDLVVWVAVTAGVMGNAMRAGVDEGKYLQKHGKWEKVGTVNIMVFVNRAMTPGAMANAIIRITEAKTSVFEDLGIRSTYSPQVQATGTGTDNVMVVAWGPGDDVFTSAGGHTKLGELVARGVREALFKAIRNQERHRGPDTGEVGGWNRFQRS